VAAKVPSRARSRIRKLDRDRASGQTAGRVVTTVTPGMSAMRRPLAGLLLALTLPATVRANPPAPVRPPGPPPGPPSPAAPAGEAAAMAERPFGRATYHPGGGLTLRSQDDRFAISINMWGQLQFTAKHDQTPVTGTPATGVTLEVRRARLVIQGHAFTPHFNYYAHLMFSPKDLGFKDGTRPSRASSTRTCKRASSSESRLGERYLSEPAAAIARWIFRSHSRPRSCAVKMRVGTLGALTEMKRLPMTRPAPEPTRTAIAEVHRRPSGLE